MNWNRIACVVLWLTALSLNGYGNVPDLPVELGLINDWAAGKVGLEPTDCDEASLDGNTVGQFNKPLFPWSDGSIEIDLEKLVKAYSIQTDEALGILVQSVLLHEYMHMAGYGDEAGSGLHPEHPHPWIPDLEDCEHFHMHVSELHFLCDSITHWLPPSTAYEHEVLAELCRIYMLLMVNLDSLRSDFSGCGVMAEKEFPGGYSIPEFDPDKLLPLCFGC